MIEKITNQNQIARHKLAEKINELIDAANGLQEAFESIHPYLKYKDLTKIQYDPAENVQDKFAEQRRWIGKACWFWDGGAKTRAFGKLNQVDTEYNDAPFQTNFGQWYEHCEPVKPDDDIIYKGDK